MPSDDAGPAPTREWLLGHLRDLIEIAVGRVKNAKTERSDRLQWSRVLVGASQACNAVLRDAEIETLREEVASLKKMVEAKIRVEAAGAS